MGLVFGWPPLPSHSSPPAPTAWHCPRRHPLNILLHGPLHMETINEATKQLKPGPSARRPDGPFPDWNLEPAGGVIPFRAHHSAPIGRRVEDFSDIVTREPPPAWPRPACSDRMTPTPHPLLRLAAPPSKMHRILSFALLVMREKGAREVKCVQGKVAEKDVMASAYMPISS